MSYLNYKFRNNVENNKKPLNCHSIWENSTYGLFLIDSSNQNVLLKSGDKGATVSAITTRTRKIQSGFHDRDNNKIYFIDCDNDNSDDQCDIWYLDLTDNSVNEMGSYVSPTSPLPLYAFDIYKWNSDFFALVTTEDTAVGGFDEYVIIKWNDPNWDKRDGFAHNNISDPMTYLQEITISGTDYLCYIVDVTNNNNCVMYKYEDSTPAITLLKNIVGISLPASRSQRGISYDNSDLIYFVLLDDDTKNYLYSYSLSGDTLTKIGEYNIALMLDRNTASGVLEKGFHVTLPRIYQISLGKAWLYHIATLNTTKTIQAITDNYVLLE